MCAIYAMLSDSHLLISELQDAVGYLAQLELRILKGIFVSGKASGEMRFNHVPPKELAVYCQLGAEGGSYAKSYSVA